jgi:two-component system, chemotaxis family, chemotaxis protein CheY
MHEKPLCMNKAPIATRPAICYYCREMNWLPFRKRHRAGSTPPTAPSAGSQAAVGRGKRILIVDDDPVIIKTTSAKLKAHGYEVGAALDAAEAMSAVRQDKPDLILLDITFPPDVAHGGSVDWDGFKIISWLQRMDEAKDIPIIVITGGDPSKYRDRALNIGAAAFFNKPIQHDELLTVIRQIIGSEARPGGAGSA